MLTNEDIEDEKRGGGPVGLVVARLILAGKNGAHHRRAPRVPRRHLIYRASRVSGFGVTGLGFRVQGEDKPQSSTCYPGAVSLDHSSLILPSFFCKDDVPFPPREFLPFFLLGSGVAPRHITWNIVNIDVPKSRKNSGLSSRKSVVASTAKPHLPGGGRGGGEKWGGEEANHSSTIQTLARHLVHL